MSWRGLNDPPWTEASVISRSCLPGRGAGSGGAPSDLCSDPGQLLPGCSAHALPQCQLLQAAHVGSLAHPAAAPALKGWTRNHTYLRMSFLLKKVQSCGGKTHAVGLQSQAPSSEPWNHRASWDRTGLEVTTIPAHPA